MTSKLLQPWAGPHGGLPPFNAVALADLGPALEEGMASHLAQLDAIAGNREGATFANTLDAMERAGQPLSRAMSIYSVWVSNLSNDAVRALEESMSPKLAAYQDAIVQNAALFARIKAVYESTAKSEWTPEQQRLAWVTFHFFEKNGANLPTEKKAELSQVNQTLASLYTRFSQNQLGDEEHHAVTVTSHAHLQGLPPSLVADAAAEALRRGQAGAWVFSNTRSSMEPLLTYASNRELREKAFRMWTSRGDNGDARDNNALVTQILKLRAQKAKLLGFATYAHWHLSDTMAKEPRVALALMEDVWKSALAQFQKDVAEAQSLARREGCDFDLQPWDFRYFAEKVRREKFDLDLGALATYLQLERVRDAMFAAAKALYGFSFTRRSDVPGFHADVVVWEVKTRDGAHRGLFYFDPYGRPGKQSGAWMTSYREQHRLGGEVTTLVSNNSNFNQGAPGEPVTLSWDDARTLFHEFGHALHGLHSQVTYPSLSGTNTARDFVELPSQFFENYLSTPQVLEHLVNAKGERIPAALLERLEKARHFNQAFATCEAQASALVDMKLHLLGDVDVDPKAFEKTTLAQLGVPQALVMRHRIPAFAHIFSGEGYAAGYYSYLWAEVLERDAFEAFLEAGSPYDPGVAERFARTILSVGNTVDPAQAFRNFRGRDPNPQALLRSKGFVA